MPTLTRSKGAPIDSIQDENTLAYAIVDTVRESGPDARPGCSTGLISSSAEESSNPMTTRTKHETVTFRHPFSLDGVSGVLPAGDYEVITDEELVEGLSFPVYRRVATMMMIPAQASVEMLNVDPVNLTAAKERDAQAAISKVGAAQAKAP